MNQEFKKLSEQMCDAEQADQTLFEFLKPKAGERFSKLEAFCDLMSRGKSGPYVLNRYGEQVEILPGQFVTTISSLSKKWQWQRATVRQFLEGLMALGQLEEAKFYSSIIFTLKRNMKLSVKVKHADDVLDFCCMQFSRFCHGRVSADEVAESYNNYYGMRMEIAMEKDASSEQYQRIFMHQAYMFETLVLSLSSQELVQENPQRATVQLALSLFGRERIWDWHKVIDTLAVLATAFRSMTPPSMLEDLVSLMTEGEKKKLDYIYSKYVGVANPFLVPDSENLILTSDDLKSVSAGECPEKCIERF